MLLTSYVVGILHGVMRKKLLFSLTQFGFFHAFVALKHLKKNARKAEEQGASIGA